MNKFHNPHLDPLLGFEKNLSLLFVPTCCYCDVFGHIKPNFHFLKQKCKSTSRLLLKKKSCLKTTYFCHHCGDAWYTHPNCFKHGHGYTYNILKFIHTICLWIQKKKKNIIQFLHNKKEYKEKNQLIVYNFTKLS